MNDKTMADRTRWKAELFNYEYYLPDESPECQYCLTEKQAEILRGIIIPLGWKTRWLSIETEIDQDQIEAFRDDLIRRLMMSCCGGDFQIIFRWTEDGVLQQSEDGGTTWEDAPQEDPRNSSPIYPPVPGEPSDDKKCIAGTGMMTLIQEQIGDQITDDMTRFTLGELIETWVTTIIQTSNPFLALINIAVNQIFALSLALLVPALTSDVYNRLKCCFIDNMADDLSFDNTQWEAVRDCILSDISGIAGIFLEHLVFLLGSVGLTNLARSQAVTEGSCDCDCTCSVASWIPYDGTAGTKIEELSSNCRLVIDSSVRGDGLSYVIWIGSSSSDCCFLTSATDITGFFDPGACAHALCGEDPASVVSGTHGGLPGVTTSTDGLLLRGGAPFRVQLDFQ